MGIMAETMQAAGLPVHLPPPAMTVADALGFSAGTRLEYPHLGKLPKEFAKLAARSMREQELRRELREMCLAHQRRSLAGDRSAQFKRAEVLGLLQLVMYQNRQAPHEYAREAYDHLFGDLSRAVEWLDQGLTPARVLHKLCDLL